MENAAVAPSDSTSEIICRVTRWYARRMIMLAGLFLVFGLVFLYDGLRGYPKSVEIAKKKEWFEKVYLPSFDQAKQEGRLQRWVEEAHAAGLPAGQEGEPPRWISYAAQNGWEEDPKHYTQREIEEQLWFAYVCFAVVLGVGVVWLKNRGKVLRGEEAHWVTPEGMRIAYADVFRIDKRAWEHKGLAYVWHRVAGQEKRAVVDDLKFDGAGRVLERMLARFSGELIEKVPEAEEELGTERAE